MHVLVTNDDGIESPGLWALVRAIRGAHRGPITVIAPETEHSSTSMSFPYRPEHRLRPLAAPADLAEVQVFAHDSSPVACVSAAMLTGACAPIDMVVAGINPGLNAGRSVMLSGTVGAAMIGALWGLPAMAVSVQFRPNQPMIWDVAAWAAEQIFPLARDLRRQHPHPLVVNVNVPHLSFGELRGIRQTGLSEFFYGPYLSSTQLETHDQIQRYRYQFVRERVPSFPPDTDEGAVKSGFISVSLISPMQSVSLPSLDEALAHLDLGRTA